MYLIELRVVRSLLKIFTTISELKFRLLGIC